jgi:uncharacterized protein
MAMRQAPRSLREKHDEALARLRSCESVIVALSGGVDSAVLLALALEALGRDRVLAVTGRSPSLPEADLADARTAVRHLDARHEVVETHELAREGYRAIAGDRCFHCRSELFEVLEALARERGIRRVVYGAILEDTRDYRPGMRAAELRGIGAPLLEAGLTKEDVRALARAAGLPLGGKPASACLASRIPVGEEVTPERLVRVGRAEQALRELGFGQLRVRSHGDVARLELDPEGDRRLSDPELRARVVREVREAGFRHVALDLEGYRTGSMNPRPEARLYRIGPDRDGGQ